MNAEITYEFSCVYPRMVNFKDGLLSRTSWGSMAHAYMKMRDYKSVIDQEHHDKIILEIRMKAVVYSAPELYTGQNETSKDS